jgi:PhnB protein
MSYQIFYHLKKGVNQMAVDIYINFNGNCREAVEYYAQVFGTDKPKIMTFGETPPDPNYPLPEEAKNLVMHTRLNIKGSNVMFSDSFPGMPFVEGNNISLSINTTNIDEIKTLFDKLKVGGKVGMELQETFWSKYYGNTKDKFGIEWQFNLDSGEVW